MDRPMPSAALAAMHEADRELGVNPVEIVIAPSPAPPPAPPDIRQLMAMDRPDWRALADEQRQAQDRQPDPEPVQAEPPPEPAAPRPAPRRGWRRSWP